MKLYFQRFIHHIGGLPDFSALKFTKYNQYESLILPLIHYLEEHHVHFRYDTRVTNVVFEKQDGRKIAREIVYRTHDGKEDRIASPRTIWYLSPTAAVRRTPRWATITTLPN